MKKETTALVWTVTAVIAVSAGALEFVFDSGENAEAATSMAAALLIFATVGALVMRRWPGHRIGTIFVLGSLAGEVGRVASALSLEWHVGAIWWLSDVLV